MQNISAFFREVSRTAKAQFKVSEIVKEGTIIVTKNNVKKVDK